MCSFLLSVPGFQEEERERSVSVLPHTVSEGGGVGGVLLLCTLSHGSSHFLFR